MLQIEAKAPANQKLRWKPWNEVLTLHNAILMQMYSHCPQKCDWDSFSHDWASFEYQLGWFCYADLAALVTTMYILWASFYLYLNLYHLYLYNIFFSFSKTTVNEGLIKSVTCHETFLYFIFRYFVLHNNNNN